MRPFLGVLTTVLLYLAGGAMASRQAAEQGIEKRLDALFAGLAPDPAPGLAVLVKADGQVLFRAGYGLRDGREKIDARTNFRLGSVSKQFTAMAAMLLVHDGKLRYDQKLTEIFPEFPAYGQAIRVRNLLDHTSGLPDYEELMDRLEQEKGPRWSPDRQIHDEQVLQLLEAADHGKFPPGTRWEYSNSGYVLLGLIVAKCSGKPFGQFLEERIFSPLGMRRTLVFEKGKNQVPDRAYGYSKHDGSFVETDQSSTSGTEGDGGIYSNLEDLGRWDDALSRHTLLSAGEFAPAITPARLPPGAEKTLALDVPASLRQLALAYGFGWFLDGNAAEPLMWHYGDTRGFKSVVLRYLAAGDTPGTTAARRTVIILSNRNDLDPGGLALEAAGLLAAGSR